MSGVKKKKSWLCLRRVVERAIRPDCTRTPRNPSFTYVSRKVQNDLVIPAFLASVSEDKFSKVSEDKEEARGPKKKSARWAFSRVLKAVRFLKLTTKKGNGRNVTQELHRLEYAKRENISNVKGQESAYRKLSSDDDAKIHSSASLRSSYSLSCSSSSSLASSLTSSWSQSESKSSMSSSDQKKRMRSNSLERKYSMNLGGDPPEKTKIVTGCTYNPNFVLYLLLTCLVVLIFFGKLWAILCTSAWLYFAPCQSTVEDGPGDMVKSPEINLKEYKKKVIMDGLLEKNHQHQNRGH